MVTDLSEATANAITQIDNIIKMTIKIMAMHLGDMSKGVSDAYLEQCKRTKAEIDNLQITNTKVEAGVVTSEHTSNKPSM